jgi:hypothetical protein
MPINKSSKKHRATSTKTNSSNKGASVSHRGAKNTEKRHRNSSSSRETKDETIARLEATIAEMSAAISNLSAGSLEPGFSQDSQDYHDSEIPANHKNPAKIPVQTSPRIKLATPVIESVKASGSRLIVTWSAVSGATGYNIRWATDANFVNNNGSVHVGASSTSATLSQLQADTLYYIRMQSLAEGTGNTDSDYSTAVSATTAGDNMAMQLQNWLDNLESELENMTSLVPELGDTWLNTLDRPQATANRRPPASSCATKARGFAAPQSHSRIRSTLPHLPPSAAKSAETARKYPPPFRSAPSVCCPNHSIAAAPPTSAQSSPVAEARHNNPASRWTTCSASFAIDPRLSPRPPPPRSWPSANRRSGNWSRTHRRSVAWP